MTTNNEKIRTLLELSKLQGDQLDNTLRRTLQLEKRVKALEIIIDNFTALAAAQEEENEISNRN